MEQLAGLDDAAFEAYYSKFRQIVYDAAIRRVGNHFEAEDVTQQVFLRVWSKPSAFRGGNFAAWLTTVAHNISIDLLRRRRAVLLGYTSLDAFQNGKQKEPSAEDEAIRELTASSLWDALQHLTPKEFPLVLAAFIAEESHEQIARSAAIPLGTVKTRIRTGLRRLRHSAAGLK